MTASFVSASSSMSDRRWCVEPSSAYRGGEPPGEPCGQRAARLGRSLALPADGDGLLYSVLMSTTPRLPAPTFAGPPPTDAAQRGVLAHQPELLRAFLRLYGALWSHGVVDAASK